MPLKILSKIKSRKFTAKVSNVVPGFLTKQTQVKNQNLYN